MGEAKWFAGAAKIAAGTVCAAWLAAVCAQAPAAPASMPANPTMEQALAQEADMRALGLPPSALAGLSYSEEESRRWAKLVAGMPGASAALWRSYSSGAGAGPVLDSGAAAYEGGLCRVVMPSMEAAATSLASMLRVGRRQALSGPFLALEAAHELGHCSELALTEAGPALGLKARFAALPVAGLASRVRGEAYADAFMAIESLAASNASPECRKALAAVASSRAREAAADPDHAAGAGAIQSALERAGSWASTPEPLRLAAASEFADAAARSALSASHGAARWSPDSLSPGPVAWEALLDASARFHEGPEGQGGPAAPDAADGGLSALASAASLALSKSGAGVDWSNPSREALSRALASAAKDPALLAAAASFAGGARESMASYMEPSSAPAKLARRQAGGQAKAGAFKSGPASRG